MSADQSQSFLTYFTGILVLIFCLLPVVWMVVVSCSEQPDFLTAGTNFSFTLANYRDILVSREAHFLDYLKNSLIVSFSSALLATSFAGLAAYAITRLRFSGRIAIPMVLLAFSMFPQISIVGYLFRMMTGLGWTNTYYALIFPYTAMALPLSLWIMLSYFSQLPQELDKAAMIDGASRWQVVDKIITPLAMPGVVSTFLLAFMLSFNEFLFALMLTTDYRARTIPVGIALFQGLHGQIPWGHIMAGAAIATLPIFVLVIFFQKRIVQGLTQGAIKA